MTSLYSITSGTVNEIGEIAKLEGKQPPAVRVVIIRVSDQLSCGEISLFEKDPEEAEAAKAKKCTLLKNKKPEKLHGFKVDISQRLVYYS